MEDKNKKKRDWSFLLTAGQPASRQVLTPEQLKQAMADLELNFDGFAVEDEQGFRDFVMAKETPGDDVVEFLKKILTDASIEYAENGFRRLSKKGYLELFFELFTLGTEAGEEADAPASPDMAASSETDAAPESFPEPQEEFVPLPLEQLTLEMMDALYSKGQKVALPAGVISSTDFTITEKLPVRAQDGFSIRLSEKAPRLAYSRAALFNTHLGKAVAVGHLEGERREPNLVFAAADIDYASIAKNRSHEIILFPASATENKFYAVECSLILRKLEVSERTLCIDFGTSNTTAGSYGVLNEGENKPEIVEFPDIDGIATQQMFPTLVYVVACEEGQPVRFAFGYEAKKRIMADHFESKATVFYEIKSWMDELEREEEIFDAQGNNSRVRRADVVKAYLEHVISLAEQHFHKRFKNLHFSAPVKLKNSFLQQMRKMFPKPDYAVLQEESSLDEGIAVVYSHIADRIKKEAEGEENAETVCVIDCGGGTTDLAKCKYWQTAANIGGGKKVLTVKTSFEHGDSAFGGNNITYRILQLLKIKIDDFLQGKPNPDMLEILDVNEIDIMTKLDEEGQLLKQKAKLYERFEKAYRDAEAHIPTRYAEAKYSDDKRCMRRNYNYLWQMAEAIKIEFYKSLNTVSVDFSKEEDRSVCIGNQEDYYLYVRRDDSAMLEKQAAPLGNIEITIKEITRILCPDIYALLIILLSDAGDKDKAGGEKNVLQDVKYIKLSGQSCNITLFHDLLKEFVPGRNIRRRSDSASGTEKAKKLKLACLEGCIRYLMDKEYSLIKPVIKTADPKLLYTVYEVKNDGTKQAVIGGGEAKVLKNFVSGRLCHFIVEDAYGQQKNSIIYNFEMDVTKRRDVSLSELQQMLAEDTYWPAEDVKEKIINSLHNIELSDEDESVQCIFLLPAKDGYGFRIYQVRVSRVENGKNKYSLIQKQPETKNQGEYHNFELMSSFFDGKR
ncbi:MAG: hypothetical protein Q4F00_07860 [bacterium]|nr:hypothetical protein [bacterium]